MNERLTARSVWQEILAQFNLEHGLIKTFVDLTKRPGEMLLGYLDGTRRNQYVSVIAYLVLSGAFCMSVITFYDFEPVLPDEQRTQLLAQFNGDTAKLEEFLSFSEIFQKNIQIMVYACLPIVALITLWIFRFWNLSYVEHLIVNTYVAAQSSIIVTPVTAAGLLFDRTVNVSAVNIGMVVQLIYMIWAFTHICQQIRPNRPFRNTVRSAATLGIQLLIVLFVVVSTMLFLFAWKAAQLT